MQSDTSQTTSHLRSHSLASTLAHLLIFSLSLLAAFVLAHNFESSIRGFFPQYLVALPLFLLVKYGVFSAFQQHQRSWRYAGYRDLASTMVACTLASGLLYAVVVYSRHWPTNSLIHRAGEFPGSVLWIDWIASNVLVMWARFALRYYFERGGLSAQRGPRKLIIGAENAGETLLREIQRLPAGTHHIVGFLDDDHKKLGTRIHGVEVLGQLEAVKHLCPTLNIEQVLIAIPSASRNRVREIIALCEGVNVSSRIVPNLAELIEGSRTIESQLRPLKLEDLLARDAVELERKAISAYLQGKKVMITGAGGSIGSEMCRQIATFGPQRLVLVEHAENNLFDIERELRERHPQQDLAPYLADICDERRMSRIFTQEVPDIVCHAAAHKHVPMLETHPGEGVKNNVVGTLTLANLAVKHEVCKFVYISTDKAVNPTSIMGCTKRIAERYVQGLSERSATQFITVRFGNVLGSRGSVVPIFQEQIAKGGPLLVTHPEMQRYFMTISEAAQLVLQAGAIGQGGEIFLLEMGEQVKIVDLARNLITMSGLTPGADIDIHFTGLRPGEKLYEELYIAGEGLAPTSHPNIKVWTMKPAHWERLLKTIPQLVATVDTADEAQIKSKLHEMVPEYQIDYKAGPVSEEHTSI